MLAYETDLLEYDDIFEGSVVIEAKTSELVTEAEAELEDVLSRGGVFEAIDELKGRLVASNTDRIRRIESGDLTVVGVNEFTETEEPPLDPKETILRVDPFVRERLTDDLVAWRAGRDDGAVTRSLDDLRRAAESRENVMGPTIDLANAGGTTGEWAGALREVFGEYRAPTGVAAAVGTGGPIEGLRLVAAESKALPGGPPRVLVAKPGLDGHSNGAEQIAVAARDAGMEVIYPGIRLTCEQIVAEASDEDVDVVGLSILSGSHLELVPETLRLLRDAGVTAPVVVGGIIPAEDRPRLIEMGVAAVYTPRDYKLGKIMADIARLANEHRGDWAGADA